MPQVSQRVPCVLVEPSHEAAHRFQHRSGLIAMWGMPAGRKHLHFDGTAGFSLYRGYLIRGAELIIQALQHQNRSTNPRQVPFDVPRSKIRIEPSALPSPERSIQIGAVVTGQLFRQIRGAKLVRHPGNCVETELLGEQMRSLEDQRSNRRPSFATGIDDRDRCSVAVADKEWLGDTRSAK